MKKVIMVWFKLFYYIKLTMYCVMPAIFIVEYYIFNDMVEFDMVYIFSLAIFCCFIGVVVIIPTVVLLKMNEDKPYKRYWWNDIFDKEKLYGKIKMWILIIAGSVLAIHLSGIVMFYYVVPQEFDGAIFFPFAGLLVSTGQMAQMAGIKLALDGFRRASV